MISKGWEGIKKYQKVYNIVFPQTHTETDYNSPDKHSEIHNQVRSKVINKHI